jgi:hypothetical protein
VENLFGFDWTQDAERPADTDTNERAQEYFFSSVYPDVLLYRCTA